MRILIALFTAVALTVPSLQAIPYVSVLVPDSDTVFLAHFDGDLQADISTVSTSAAASEFDMARGRFGRGVRPVSGTKGILSYTLNSPWTSGEGALAVWVKLDWNAKANVTNGRTIFDLYTKNEKVNRLRLYVYSNGEKAPGSTMFLVISEASGRQISYGIDIGSDLKWMPGEWHHIAVSFASGQGISFSIDGAPKKTGKVGETWTFDLSDATLFVGVPFHTASYQAQGKDVVRFDGVIDELMLSQRTIDLP